MYIYMKIICIDYISKYLKWLLVFFSKYLFKPYIYIITNYLAIPPGIATSW